MKYVKLKQNVIILTKISVFITTWFPTQFKKTLPYIANNCAGDEVVLNKAFHFSACLPLTEAFV